jgi:hypothetical protein
MELRFTVVRMLAQAPPLHQTFFRGDAHCRRPRGCFREFDDAESATLDQEAEALRYKSLLVCLRSGRASLLRRRRK